MTANIRQLLLSYTCKTMTPKQLIPLGDNVIVRPLEEELSTASGIIIPDTASKEKPMRGKVIAVTKDCNTVSVGDVVIFTKYAPTEIKVEGQELYVLNLDSLLAIEK